VPNLLTYRILGILSYAFLLLGFVSWAIFDVGAGLTIIFFLSSAVLYADEDAANGINMLKQRRIDWRRKLIPPLIMMHAGLFFVILSSLYDLGPFSLVSFFLVAFGYVISSRPYLPDQSTRRSSSVSRYIPIVHRTLETGEGGARTEARARCGRAAIAVIPGLSRHNS